MIGLDNLLPEHEDKLGHGRSGRHRSWQHGWHWCEGKWGKTVNSAITDSIILQGGKRLVKTRPPNCIASWPLSANESAPAGIPASLIVVIIVSREDQKSSTAN